MKKITLLFITIITSVTFAQTTIGESDLFNTTTNTTWTQYQSQNQVSQVRSTHQY